MHFNYIAPKFSHQPTRHALTVALLSLTALMTGCISPKSYVDPALSKVSYNDLSPSAQKHPVQLLFEFQSNDKINAAATNQLRPQAVNVLKKSGMFSEVVETPATSDYKIFLTINNVPVTKDAAAKGVATGLTFGLAGNMVTDGYQCKATYQAPGKEPITKNYVHAIHTTIGNADGPAGLQPMKPIDAANKVVEDVELNLLNDLSKEGKL